MNFHSMPSRWYSSCSRMNIWGGDGEGWSRPETWPHRVVEQLLQLLVCVVDAELLETVQLEDLESGDIEDADEAGPLTLGAVQGPVDPRDDPLEQTLVGRLGDRLDVELDLLLGLGLDHMVPADLDPRLEEGLGQVGHLDAQQVRHLAEGR
jgi:hypothetical protein